MKKILLLLSVFILFSCLSRYEVPEEYVPDNEVVYLKQKVEYQPIHYEPVTTQPYEWDVQPEIDTENPSFLRKTSFSHFLKPSLFEDALTFIEVKNYLTALYQDEEVQELIKLLAQENFPAQPELLKSEKGKQIKEYNNSIEYSYPPVKDATIIIFNKGDYKIKFKDGSSFYYNSEGYYFQNDKDDKELFAVFPEKNQYRVISGEITYRQFENLRKVETKSSQLDWNTRVIPQYVYKKNDIQGDFFFLLDENMEVADYIYSNEDKGIRFDYIPENDRILITSGKEAVTIDNNYEKGHFVFDEKELKTTDLLSYYLPEGLRITDFNKDITSSTLNPAWPENYKAKKMGGFTIFYTEKDRMLLDKLDSGILKKVAGQVKKVTGLDFAASRSIILPPDLESYRKIHAMDEEETLLWYPSGYQLTDIIVMWPPSVKRYNAPEGEAYFWEEEFYEILLHELAHLAVGENSGVFSAVPVWLNEGLALYAEGQWSADSKSYWELVFMVSFHTKNLLPWDDVTTKSTSEYQVSKARVHYAQSAAMVDYLIGRYGIEKVTEYVASFKGDINDSALPDLKKAYKTNFKTIFGIEWSENVTAFNESIPK